MKKLAILGSTGSIGTQALDVISHAKDSFEVVGLAAATFHLEFWAMYGAMIGAYGVFCIQVERIVRDQTGIQVVGLCMDFITSQ